MLLQEEIFVARAPGRLDVMGGIADYSGSLVLQVKILYYWFFGSLVLAPIFHLVSTVKGNTFAVVQLVEHLSKSLSHK